MSEINVRIDTTLTGELAKKFLARKEKDGDEINAKLAKRLIKIQLDQDEKKELRANESAALQA